MYRKIIGRKQGIRKSFYLRTPFLIDFKNRPGAIEHTLNIFVISFKAGSYAVRKVTIGYIFTENKNTILFDFRCLFCGII